MEKDDQGGYCELCKAKFSMMLRKHQCKRCVRDVCYKCGTNKSIIIGYKDQQQHRVCDTCTEEIKYQKNLREINQISWNQKSKISNKWCSQAYLDIEKFQIEVQYTYQDKLTQIGTLNQQLLESVKQEIDHYELNDQNYSFLEFFHHTIKDQNHDMCKINASKVMLAILLDVPDMHNIKGLVQMTFFMLCFNDEESAFWILTILIQQILPKKYFQPNYVEQQSNFLIKLSKQQININQQLEKNLFNFFLLHRNKMFPGIFVNCLNFQCVYYIWDTMFYQKSFVEVEKNVIALVQIHSKLLMDNKLDMNKLLNITQINELRVENKKLKLDQETREKLSGETLMVPPRRESILNLNSQFEQFQANHNNLPNHLPRQSLMLNADIDDLKKLQKSYSVMENPPEKIEGVDAKKSLFNELAKNKTQLENANQQIKEMQQNLEEKKNKIKNLKNENKKQQDQIEQNQKIIQELQQNNTPMINNDEFNQLKEDKKLLEKQIQEHIKANEILSGEFQQKLDLQNQTHLMEVQVLEDRNEGYLEILEKQGDYEEIASLTKSLITQLDEQKKFIEYLQNTKQQQYI